MIEKQTIVDMFTDGACSGNPGFGGYGVILKYKGKERALSGAYRLTTNNRMELIAVIKGLDVLKVRCIVNVYTDSRLIVDALTKGWLFRWSSNDWMRNRKEKVLNADLWEELLGKSRFHKLRFTWVKGHSGHVENERCDLMAKEAIKKQVFLDDKFYEKTVQH